VNIDQIRAAFARRVTDQVTLADGTQVRLRHEFLTTHVDVRRPGQEPTYQGVVHPWVLGKGWPAQFATGKASGRTHLLRHETHYPTKEEAIAALVEHQSQRRPDEPWDDTPTDA